MNDDREHGRADVVACTRYGAEEAEALAALHASDALEASETKDYDRHVDECTSCRSLLRANREALAEAVFTASPVEPPAGLRSSLLDATRAERAESVQVFKRWSTGAESAAGLKIVRSNEGEWVESAPGVRFKQLAVDEERRYVTMLVRMEPGTSYPSHHHRGTEECYVLEGDLQVAGQSLAPGDYQLAPEGSDHGVQSTENGCLLLIVSSQDDELL